MALAANLIPGFTYRINAGPLQDELVTIVDNTPFPDGDPQGRQRKVTVDSDGHTTYILPRLLDNRPVAIAAPAPVAQPVVTSAPITALPAAVAAPQYLPTPDVSVPITDPMDVRLDHLRPSRAKVRRYLSREMSNGMKDVDFLLTFVHDNYRADNEGRPANIMLKGDTGSGKTFLVEVLAVLWAEKMGLPKPMPIFTLSGSSGVTDYDLFGQTTSFTDPYTGHESLVFLPGVADLAAQVGGILYLDEVNAMAERVTSSLHPLADHRHAFTNRNKAVLRGGQYMPEVVVGSLDLWIIGTYNEGYRGMGEMNEAFINRFRHIRWGYDKAVEERLIKSPTVRLLGDRLRTARAQSKLRTPVGTATLQRIEADTQAFGPVLAMEILVGLFKLNEQAKVEDIIQDCSILIMLNEEIRQAESDARRDA